MISIIIPAYNEERRLPKTLDRLIAEFGDSVELVISDDGSTDTTEAIVRLYKKEHSNIRYVWGYHKGRGGALKNGIAVANGDTLVLSSSDIAFNKEELLQRTTYLISKDMVIVKKTTKPKGAIRWLASFGFHMLTKFWLGLPYSDTQSVKILNRRAREVALKVNANDFIYDTELMVRAHRANLDVQEAGPCYDELSGPSTVRFKSVFDMAIGIIKLGIRGV